LGQQTGLPALVEHLRGHTLARAEIAQGLGAPDRHLRRKRFAIARQPNTALQAIALRWVSPEARNPCVA